jgi:hypothetical protein
LLVIKPGFVRGTNFGGQAASIYYSDITSIETNVAPSNSIIKNSLSRLLLLLLLSSLYFSPYQISRLPQHFYDLLLGWSIKLHGALHSPNVIHSLSQRLHRILLRLLLVATFRHRGLLSHSAPK